jgi:hypothetical protein
VRQAHRHRRIGPERYRKRGTEDARIAKKPTLGTEKQNIQSHVFAEETASIPITER